MTRTPRTPAAAASAVLDSDPTADVLPPAKPTPAWINSVNADRQRRRGRVSRLLVVMTIRVHSIHWHSVVEETLDNFRRTWNSTPDNLRVFKLAQARHTPKSTASAALSAKDSTAQPPKPG